jgi:hypothetical protein
LFDGLADRELLPVPAWWTRHVETLAHAGEKAGRHVVALADGGHRLGPDLLVELLA